MKKVHHLTIAIGIALFIFVIVRPPIEFIRQYLAQWTSNKILYDIRKKVIQPFTSFKCEILC